MTKEISPPLKSYLENFFWWAYRWHGRLFCKQCFEIKNTLLRTTPKYYKASYLLHIIIVSIESIAPHQSPSGRQSRLIFALKLQR